ncbi:hypothetical protein [Luteimonas kalidii]|uniref:Uncharacterized protein n=1 Tax=Luteimonas kalidii TaxID=3042025 RepID=A0ABT6JWL3_9GAMM|nr:hypothetical protein [Luteimonas kalidii]MDH5835088.1 hypothetical protein [Luteimonas kalidii]
MNASVPELAFPRTVFDDSGSYIGGGTFRVESPSIEMLAILAWTHRDLSTALDLIRECCKDEWEEHEGPVSQALWWSAVVIYSKPFKFSEARRHLPRRWARDYLEQHVSTEALDVHEYVMHLRDKMMAHDDGLGEHKHSVLVLPATPPTNHVHIGVGTGNTRVVSLGTNIARQLEPHFASVNSLFEKLWQQQFEAVRQHLMTTRFSEVEVLGPHIEEELEIDLENVLAAYGRAGTCKP